MLWFSSWFAPQWCAVAYESGERIQEEKSNETIYHLFHFYGNELNLASHLGGCVKRSITLIGGGCF